MEFSDNKPIYRQIADYAFNNIIDGSWPPGEKIPSVRELAALLGVNTRTVLKAMEYLQDARVITPRRGMGFILTEDAAGQVVKERRREFFEVTLPALRQEMERLGISREEVTDVL
ncbi:MAG: GntR family transcriptional regulator [Muribaculaceae bacterium]|nr:GntR family transcriptional regulator [Muribaculaceae bacterium]